MTTYLSGPITGNDNYVGQFAFAASRLRRDGYEVINPVETDDYLYNPTWQDYLRQDLPELVKCDDLATLPGWRESKGAKLEVHIAQALDMPIRHLPDTVVVGLMGYAQSGKDTTAGFMAPAGFRRLAFADALKDVSQSASELELNLAGYEGWVFEEMVEREGWERVKTFPGVRAFLQDLGLRVRKYDENFWINSALNQIELGDKVVITDVRYPNEVQAVKDLGGTLIRITRPGVGPVNAHVSESAVENIDADIEIANCGSLGDLQSLVELTVEEVLSQRPGWGGERPLGPFPEFTDPQFQWARTMTLFTPQETA